MSDTATDTLPRVAQSSVTTPITSRRTPAVRAETITIGLNVVAVFAFSAGAVQFNRLANAVELLGARLESINTRLAVLEAARSAERIERLLDDVGELKATALKNSTRIDALERHGGPR